MIPFPDKKYSTIYADPPWKYGSWGPGSNRMYTKGYTDKTSYLKPLPYKWMDLDDIKLLPISDLAEYDCELYLWTTQKYLPDVFDVIKAWGFRYCQTLTWCKTPRGLGQGGVYCPTTEFLTLSRRGGMPNIRRNNSTWFHTKRPHNSHSTKPQFFRELIESVTDPPRIELFAREHPLGWDVWGDEA